MELKPAKKIYFSSDNHLGLPNEVESKKREKKFIAWLNEIKKDAQVIFLLGDLFDFWYEYKYVVPKGFVRVLGKLAECTDQGIDVHFFVGNHDPWMIDYFEKELNIKVHFQPLEFTFNQHRFFLGHGDGLGPGDKGYKFLKKIFRNRFLQWCFRWVHPDIGMPIGISLSKNNKLISGDDEKEFLGEKKEWLIQYALKKEKVQHRDFYIFGHRHFPIEHQINKNSTYINLGDWVTYFTFAEYDGTSLELKKYQAP